MKKNFRNSSKTPGARRSSLTSIGFLSESTIDAKCSASQQNKLTYGAGSGIQSEPIHSSVGLDGSIGTLSGNSERNLMTAREAAEYLGVKYNTLAAWRCTKQRIIPYIKIGSKVKYRRSDLDQFMSDNLIVGGCHE